MNTAYSLRRAPEAAALPAHRGPRPFRRATGLLAALLIGLAALFLQAPAAQAHDELVGADPAADARVQKAPEKITLSYSGNISDIGNAVHVTDSHGDEIAQGDPKVQGKDLTQKISPKDGDETYTVTWRVVSEDGHPIQGKYSFTAGQGGSGSSEGASGDSSANASAGSSADSDQDSSSTKSSAQDSEGLPLWAVALIGAALALALLGVIALLIGRSRQKKQDAREARPQDENHQHRSGEEH